MSDIRIDGGNDFTQQRKFGAKAIEVPTAAVGALATNSQAKTFTP